ncbi:hypothetical protein L227DRAFT_609354 [Lentinus tigrinus ALCF2SS1-6]|uniref:F-box domain-containing protein n=1 Tax=Lentinus tigrinus ALCF2SS1-6 TaxID=1328759 RepID=A0A5C2SGE2_9APHY|nr:hypothetical protein L227DRAFT_609354 [Lentinus tigrinus ALCF2SS1-6]
MDNARFSLDIFHVLMTCSDRPTVSRLMRTCSALKYEGTRSILAKDPELHTGPQTESFVQFAAAGGDPAESARRLGRLRGLSVGVFETEEEVMVVAPLLKQFFVECASYMNNFVRLNIDGFCDLVPFEPELPAAITMLTTLRTLFIRAMGGYSTGMLGDLQSRLTHASITIAGGLVSGCDDVVALLQHSKDTLRSLSLQFVLFPVQSSSPPCFPHLRRLSLNHAANIFTRNLAAAFPNLDRLEASCYTLTTVDMVDDNVLDGERADNIAEQQAGGSWSSLRRFTGSLAILYILGLTCHVPVVSVGLDHNEKFNLNWARAIVEDTRPTHLTFNIRFLTYIANQSSHPEDLTALFSHQGFQDVEVLRVKLILDWKDRDLDLELLLDAFLQALAVCPAKAVVLTVKSYSFPPRDLCEPPSEAEEYLRSFDAEALVDRLVAMAPSFRTIRISHCDGYHEERVAQWGPDIVDDLDDENEVEN